VSAGLGPQRLSRVLEYIEGNIDQPLLLKDLAAHVTLSPFHFARMFKDSTGHPPHAFVRERRVARAAALLEGTELPIFEIARQCGFRTQSHFTGVYRQVTGTTPKRFRTGVKARPVTLGNDPA
jgi:AraC family transcriptional regulator